MTSGSEEGKPSAPLYGLATDLQGLPQQRHDLLSKSAQSVQVIWAHQEYIVDVANHSEINDGIGDFSWSANDGDAHVDLPRVGQSLGSVGLNGFAIFDH